MILWNKPLGCGQAIRHENYFKRLPQLRQSELGTSVLAGLAKEVLRAGYRIIGDSDGEESHFLSRHLLVNKRHPSCGVLEEDAINTIRLKPACEPKVYTGSRVSLLTYC